MQKHNDCHCDYDRKNKVHALSLNIDYNINTMHQSNLLHNTFFFARQIGFYFGFQLPQKSMHLWTFTLSFYLLKILKLILKIFPFLLPFPEILPGWIQATIQQNIYIIKIFEYWYGKIGETINSPVVIIALTDLFDGTVPIKILQRFPLFCLFYQVIYHKFWLLEKILGIF